MARFWRLLAMLVAAQIAAPAVAAEPSVVATVETEANFDDDAGGDADADDPAIWINPIDRRYSLVLGTLKNGGLSVFDLDGKTIQRVATPPAPGEDEAPGRFNNVDLLQNFVLGARRVDLAVVTDRGLDKLRLYRINPLWHVLNQPALTDITSPSVPWVFSTSQDEVNEQATGYGLAVGALGRRNLPVGFVSRRHRTAIARVAFFAAGNGLVSYRVEDVFSLPSSFVLPNGATWTPCLETDEELAQVEGMVLDRRHEFLYAAQEDVGIWKIPVKNTGAAALIDRVREFGVPYSRIFDPEEEEFVCELDEANDPGFGSPYLAADAEGLTIYEYGFSKGYLIASSQGSDEFLVYERTGANAHIGNFRIDAGNGIDSVEESDGAMVVNTSLPPRFPFGLFVAHDGDNTPEVLDEEGEARANTNFKFVPWQAIAKFFDPRLVIQPGR